MISKLSWWKALCGEKEMMDAIAFEKMTDLISFRNIFHFPSEIYHLSLIVRVFCHDK
jgi:hypothetical protein